VPESIKAVMQACAGVLYSLALRLRVDACVALDSCPHGHIDLGFAFGVSPVQARVHLKSTQDQASTR